MFGRNLEDFSVQLVPIVKLVSNGVAAELSLKFFVVAVKFTFDAVIAANVSDPPHALDVVLLESIPEFLHGIVAH